MPVLKKGFRAEDTREPLECYRKLGFFSQFSTGRFQEVTAKVARTLLPDVTASSWNEKHLRKEFDGCNRSTMPGSGIPISSGITSRGK